MIYYRCKCGEYIAYGSMPPSPCTGCSKCGTTLDTSPTMHSTPIPHVFKTRYNGNTGEPYELCTICGRTKDELEGEKLNEI